ncbi:MAG: SH3 domain-containing protein [Pseudomonadota bacterium]
MTKWIVLVGALFLVPGVSVACGSVEDMFERMRFETDKAPLESFLEDFSCGTPSKYSPERADTYIAMVLINAARARVSKDKVQATLSSFNCAYSARHYHGYVEIKAYLGDKRFGAACDLDVIERVYVVTANGGANLRTKPSISAPKLGAIAEGVAVRNGTEESEWVLVDTYLGRGYMHVSTLRRYVEES